MNYRVVVSGNSGDGFLYRIEDVIDPPRHGMYPFVSHPQGLATAPSIGELRGRLRLMLEACDRPLTVLVESAPKVIELEPAADRMHRR